MMNLTDPKSLVYGELYFITSSARKTHSSFCMDIIFDEVSREVYELFVGTPAIEASALVEPAVSLLGNPDVISIN
jgi:hypothetical protein